MTSISTDETISTKGISIPIATLGNSLETYIADIEEEELTESINAEKAVVEVMTPTQETSVIEAEESVVTQIIETQIIEAQTEPTKAEVVVDAEQQTPEVPETYRIPNYKAISASRAPLNLDLAGAKRVALGEILPASNVYFIQLAALSKSSGNVNKFYHSLSMVTCTKYLNLQVQKSNWLLPR